MQLDLIKHRGLQAIRFLQSFMQKGNAQRTKTLKIFLYVCLSVMCQRKAEVLNNLESTGSSFADIVPRLWEKQNSVRPCTFLDILSNNKMQTDRKTEYIPRPAHLIPALGLNNGVLVFLGFDLEQSGLSYQVPFGLGTPAAWKNFQIQYVMTLFVLAHHTLT